MLKVSKLFLFEQNHFNSLFFKKSRKSEKLIQQKTEDVAKILSK